MFFVIYKGNPENDVTIQMLCLTYDPTSSLFAFLLRILRNFVDVVIKVSFRRIFRSRLEVLERMNVNRIFTGLEILNIKLDRFLSLEKLI